MMKRVFKKFTRKSTSTKTAKKTSTVTKTKQKKTGKISSEELFVLIEKMAYDFYQQRGSSHGDDKTDWYRAEQEVSKTVKK